MTTKQVQDLKKIECMLIGIKFQKDGFIIGQFQHGKRNIIAKGNLLNAEEGMTYKLTGDWENHSKYGNQFAFKTFETIIPHTTEGIYRYIVRTAKWVGPIIGEALIQKYGDQTLDILKTEPDRVAREINGITIERAKEISQNLLDNEAMESTLIQIEEMIGGSGLRKNIPVELYKKYGETAPRVLKDNPYILADLHGVGFPTADMVAVKKIGVDPKSQFRQMSAILHIIQQNFLSGHTWIEEKNLKSLAKELIGQDVSNGLDELLKKESIVFYPFKPLKNGNYVTIFAMAVDEQFVAKKLLKMCEPEILVEVDDDEDIAF